jgi:Chromo (CHRromatin Organisation MOdifier) domain
MDFIVELPPSQGFDAVYACVDRLTKMAHFVPTYSDVTSEQTADLYLRNVFKMHGLPDDVVSDRGTQFVSKFSRRLLELLDVKGNRSTAYHPESDGQTERVNQTLEQYLRIYCDFHQDDWSQLLPLAEFAYNNARNSSTGMSPFYANYGYHPRASLKVQPRSDQRNPAAEDLANHLKQVHEELRWNLGQAQERYKKNFDRKANPAPPFVVGDLVWLNRKNIATTRPSRKFDSKRFGPFKILKVVGDSKLAFQLELPPQWKIHDVFHASLLDPHHANEIEGRKQPTPHPPEAIEGIPEYEVGEILDSKIERRKLWYKVDWKGYGPEERTWEPAENVENAAEAVATYHQRHPQRASPDDVPRAQRPRETSAAKKGGTVTNVTKTPSRQNARTRRDPGSRRQPGAHPLI